MKNKFATILVIALVALCLCAALVACTPGTPTECTVTLDYNGATGGNAQKSITVTTGQRIGTLPTPTRTGFEFGGWYYKDRQITADTVWSDNVSAATFLARWNLPSQTYLVTWVADGETIASQRCPADALEYTINKFAPAVPEKPGYTGVWEQVEPPYEQNIVINAVYSAETYTITFVADGREFEVIYKMGDASVTEPAVPEKPGYNGAWEHYTLDGGDKTVNAVYTGKQYTAALDYDGATGGNSQQTVTLTYQSAIGNNVLPTPTRTGYLFLGWYLGSSKIGPNTVWSQADNNATLVAKWEPRPMLDYALSDDGNSYTVTRLASWVTESNLALEVPATYKEKPVTAIANQTFKNNAKLRSISLPVGVQTIGDEAFYGCANLASVQLGGVQTIGEQAFYNCKQLAQLQLPAALQTIGDEAFYGCANLASVQLGGVQTIGEQAFANCENIGELVLPAGLTQIGANAFEACTSLLTVTVNSNATIGDNAFDKCYRLVEICNKSTLALTPESADNGKIAFYAKNVYGADNGSKLAENNDGYVIYNGNTLVDYRGADTQITIPAEIAVINGYALYHRSITAVTVPQTVTEICLGAFNGCADLESITLPFIGDRLKTAADNNQYPFGYIFGKDRYDGGAATEQRYVSDASNANAYTDVTYYIPTKLKSVTITGGEILSWAFSKCVNIRSITIPQTVTSIGNDAFWCCYALQDFEIPANVTSIGIGSFMYCKALTEITIPANVSNLQQYVLAYCDNLATVTILNNEADANQYAFSGSTAISHVVAPMSVLTAMPTANLVMVEINGGANIDDLVFKNSTKLTNVTIPDSITSVAANAFAACTNLQYNEYDNGLYLGNDDNLYVALIKAKSTEITACAINDNTKVIAGAAFSGCGSLGSIDIPNTIIGIGAKAFYGCSGAQTLTLGTGINSVALSTFENCSGLTSVTIPACITQFGSSAFAGCSSLNAVYYMGSLEQWCNIDFANADANPLRSGHNLYLDDTLVDKLVIPEALTDVGKYTFNGIGSTEIVIPETVQTIAEGAFNGCATLEKLTIPFVGGERKTHTATKQYPFGYIFGKTKYTGGVFTSQEYIDTRTTLETVSYYIPASLKSVTVTSGEILQGAFSSCNIESVTLNEGITYVGMYAFKNSRIKNVVISTTVESLSSYTFWGCNNITSATMPTWAISDVPKDKLESVVINGGTLIPENAFAGLTTLTSIEIKDANTAIDAKAFSGCTNLQTVKIASGVTAIDATAFNGCTNITSATIPAAAIPGVPKDQLATVVINGGTEIAADAFNGCTTLRDLTIDSSVTTIGAGAFVGCNLTNFNYTGDVAAWCNIDFANADSNPISKAQTVTFNNVPLSTDLVLPADLTTIKPYAFYGSAVTSVTIPESLTTLGAAAFENCTSLTMVNWNATKVTGSSSALAFKGCTNFTTLNVGDTVTSFPYWGAYPTESVNVSNVSVWLKISFGSQICNPLRSTNALYADGALVTELKDLDVTSINATAFSNYTGLVSADLTGVTSIGSYAFQKCTGLKNVVIPDSVTYISSSAFKDCTALESVDWNAMSCLIPGYSSDCLFDGASVKTLTIGDAVTKIPKYLFAKCAIETLNVGSGVSTIEADAFMDSTVSVVNIANVEKWCGIYFDSFKTNPLSSGAELHLNGAPITELNLSVNVKMYTFYGCTSITSVTLTDMVTSVGYSAFAYCSNLNSVTFGNNIKTIGGNAFNQCKKLVEVTLPDSVTTMDSGVFKGCSGLISAKLPANITTLPNQTFEDCSSLASIVLPDGMTTIGNSAFKNCNALTSIVIPDSLTTVNARAFDWYSGALTVYYKGTEAQWSGITINSFNDYLTNATRYYFSVDEPALTADGTAYNGNYWRYVEGVPTIWVKE